MSVAKGGEIAGVGPHDGIVVDLTTHTDVVALVVVTRGPDGLDASLSDRDDADVDPVVLSDLLADLARAMAPAGQDASRAAG